MAIFETMRVRDGEIPLLGRHLERFSKNQRATGLEQLPPDCGIRLEKVASDRPYDHVVRAEWNGSELVITTRDLPSPGSLALVVSSVVHPGYPIKTTDRDPFDRARREARELGADEAVLLTDDGIVAEGTIFTIGWFEANIMMLPALDLKILPGIGRARVLECAARLGMEVAEGRFLLEDFRGRPAFATTSVRGVVGVSSLDGVALRPHPAVEKLANLFWP